MLEQSFQNEEQIPKCFDLFIFFKAESYFSGGIHKLPGKWVKHSIGHYFEDCLLYIL